MDRCPHCGRALRPDAEACPHCGSDFETGWNPDADYYGFELPSDEDSFTLRDEPASGRGIVWDTVVGSCAIGVAGLLFLLVLGSRAIEEPANLVVIGLLAASLWFFFVRTREESA